jgi:hypothetical protein
MALLSASHRQWAWISLLTVSSLVFSLAFACATPFAAFAALAALYFARADAAALVLGIWLINQIVGYAVLGYPQTFDSYAWGIAIGVAAIMALVAAFPTNRWMQEHNFFIRVGAVFAAAFCAYELALLATTLLLPSGPEAFSLRVVGEILVVNALALGGLIICEQLAIATGIASAPSPTR